MDSKISFEKRIYICSQILNKMFDMYIQYNHDVITANYNVKLLYISFKILKFSK